MPIWRDLLELYLAPGSAALLPWTLGFRWLRFLARRAELYRQETEQARDAFRNHESARVDDTWAWRNRLIRLVDHADLYLSMSRRDAWLDRRLEVLGKWPERGPFLAVTFHWGTGLWSLRHLRRAGFHAAMLSTPVAQAPALGDLRARYGRLRNGEVARAGGAAVIYLGGSKTRIRTHLAAGGVLVGLLDVPPNQTPASLPVSLLDRDSTLPRGLFDLALEGGLPVVPFLLGLDAHTGRRELRILPPLVGLTAQAQADEAAAVLSAALREDSAAWHRWPDAPLFFPAEASQRRQTLR